LIFLELCSILNSMDNLFGEVIYVVMATTLYS